MISACSHPFGRLFQTKGFGIEVNSKLGVSSSPVVTVQTIREQYHQWQILVVPIDAQKWGFRASPSEQNGSDSVSDGVAYDTIDYALNQAKAFVNRLSVRDRICTLLDDWVEAQKISTEDYVRVSQLLGELARL